MYGQMTAGSWIYIGTQGILQGTYETFAAIAAKRFGGSLRGTITLTAGLGGMGGAQPLAVTMNGGVATASSGPVAHHPPYRVRLPRRAGGQHGRRHPSQRRQGQGPAPVHRPARQRRRHLPAALASNAPIDIVTDQTSAHDPLTYVPQGVAFEDRPPCAPKTPQASPAGPASRWPSTSQAWSASSTPGPRCSTTATPSAARPSWPGTSGRSTSPASSRPTSGRCSARARARSAGWPCPEIPATSPHRPGHRRPVPGE